MNICVMDDRWYTALVVVRIPSFFFLSWFITEYYSTPDAYSMINTKDVNSGSELFTFPDHLSHRGV
jgi:hypothetical protein